MLMNISVGDRVTHPSHGMGTVLRLYIDDSADVQFDKDEVFVGDEGRVRVTTSLLVRVEEK